MECIARGGPGQHVVADHPSRHPRPPEVTNGSSSIVAKTIFAHGLVVVEQSKKSYNWRCIERGREPRLQPLARRSLALRPAHSRCHQFVTRIPKASAISSPPQLLRLLPA